MSGRDTVAGGEEEEASKEGLLDEVVVATVVWGFLINFSSFLNIISIITVIKLFYILKTIIQFDIIVQLFIFIIIFYVKFLKCISYKKFKYLSFKIKF